MELAPGVELIGRYQGSGFKEPRYTARRADGQVVQMPRLVYLVAAHLGAGDLGVVAERVTAEFGRPVSPANVEYLIENKLRPAGLVSDPSATAPVLKRAVPLLALRFRTRVVPARLVASLTFLFRPFFLPPVIAVIVGALVAFDVWLFAVHGVTQSFRQLLYEPELILLVFGLMVASAIFHELGHATACRYGGARPGAMGVGIYVVWPAFFTDVTDAYRLPRSGRLRTDLGGIYFNAISMVAIAAAYSVTGAEVLLAAIVLQHLEIVHQLLPFLRLDGYYILSDLTGIPDLFARIRPALTSLLPWRRSDERVTELRPGARTVLIVWVLLLIPVVASIFTMIALAAPRLLATAIDSGAGLASDVVSSTSAGQITEASIATLQILTLVLPLIGIALLFARVARRLATTVRRVSGPHGSQRAAAVVVLSAAGTVLLSGVMWVDGDPLRPNEKGTLGEAFHGVGEAAGRIVAASRSAIAADGDGSAIHTPERIATPADPNVTATVMARSPASGISSGPAPPAPSPAGDATRTPSPSPSPTPTPSPTPSPSPSEDPSPSPTPSSSPSEDPSSSPSPSPTP